MRSPKFCNQPHSNSISAKWYYHSLAVMLSCNRRGNSHTVVICTFSPFTQLTSLTVHTHTLTLHAERTTNPNSRRMATTKRQAHKEAYLYRMNPYKHCTSLTSHSHQTNAPRKAERIKSYNSLWRNHSVRCSPFPTSPSLVLFSLATARDFP